MQPSVEISDEDLLGRYYCGQEECFDTLERRYRAKLFAFAQRMLENREDAWDAVQDMWVRMVSRRPPQLNVKALLYKILTNLCFDRLRANRHDIPLDDMNPTKTPRISEVETVDTALSARQFLNALLGELDPRERAILLLRLEGYGNGEIAAIMGISQSYASNIYRDIMTRATGLADRKNISR